MQNATELGRILHDAVATHEVVLVDFSGTTYCGSAGLGVLLEGLHDARMAGRDIRLVVGCPAVPRTGTIVGLIGLFGVYRTVTEAMTG